MRLIDADALLEKSWDVDCRIGYVQVVDVGDILEAPTIDPVKWIPVSERLPEKNGEYLVTKIDCITCERLVDIAYHGDFICTNNGFYKTNDVVAWMPLTEPWKGEEDE